MRAYRDQRGKAIRILIVEDDQILASFITGLLVDLGFDVAGVVSTSSEAAAIAHDERPDLALVDLRLGRPMAGIEVARMLDRDFGVLSVFLSGSADEPETRTQDGHFGTVLDAPLRPSQALKAVEEALDLLRE